MGERIRQSAQEYSLFSKRMHIVKKRLPMTEKNARVEMGE